MNHLNMFAVTKTIRPPLMLVEQIFRHLHMPPKLACEFLATFSRMEYALKSTKYAIGDDKKVDPAWDRFANDIHEAFEGIAEPDLLEAKNYLLSHPPRKQTLAGHKITFIDQAIDAKQRTSQQLLLMVRTVRNNLFHGGKYLPDGEQEEGRNNLLVKHSLTVLLACSKLDHEVRSSFEH
ncbi:MAG: hypothetical protein A3H31_10935 [Gallionellales bacterium RIFCSPLOWO2_02_FULL_57_47]|nr:MAG: hypothetical protein A3H31_10935 [Gallionellales bacterium RIFCSPLOWO2_02_FULL_57_47]OGT15372.1 MAG: hypothetical protein A3J49_10195 [Gallionellales bacterium RIFCSPHIGHO2_02_FULL_57_16]